MVQFLELYIIQKKTEACLDWCVVLTPSLLQWEVTVHIAMCYNMSIAEDYRNTIHFILNDCLGITKFCSTYCYFYCISSLKMMQGYFYEQAVGLLYLSAVKFIG